MKKSIKILSLTLSCVATLTMAGSALGQELTSGNSSLETKVDSDVTNVFTLAPSFTHLFDSDFKGTDNGNVSVTRADMRVGYAMKSDQAEFGLGGLYEFSNYDFSKLGYEEFNRLAFSAYYKGMVNDNWGYFGYGAVEMAANTGAALGNGVMGTLGGGARYVWSDKLSLGFGLAASSSLEDNSRVLPVIILNWQINDRWALRTLNGVTVTYDLMGDKKTFLDAGVNYQRREYRLEKHSSFGNYSTAPSMVETLVNIEFGVTHNFNKDISLRGFVGLVGGRGYDIYENGHKRFTKSVDTGGMVGVRAIFRF